MKKRVVCLILSAILLLTESTAVMATNNKAEIQRQKAAAEQELEEAQQRVADLSEQQAAISAQIDDTNAELVDMLIQIDVATQDIAATEGRITETQGQIDVTTQELAIAEADKQQQYESMKTRIRYIYENGGDAAWFRMILEVNDITTMLNRAEYAQSMHDYDRKMLAEFAAVVQQVTDLKANLESQKVVLEEERDFLVLQKTALQEQEAQLQISLAQMQATSSDYAAQISQARSQAESISQLIAEQQAELERIAAAEEAARRAAEEAARREAEEAARREAEEAARREEEDRQQNSGGSSNSSNSSSNSGSNRPSSGSGASSIPPYTGDGSGASIVAYAEKFVGNPYVYGGNDLIHGIDCSHFVYQILKRCGVYNGGYVTSGGWRSKGTPVSSLAEARAGDVICYSGHVAIYDGYGGIVEAKGRAWGITHDREATCNPILAIRRFT